MLFVAAAAAGYAAGAQRSAASGLAWGLVAVALVLVAVVLAVAVVRGAAVAMSALAGAMRRFGGGDLAARARVAGPAELRRLAGDFNAMAESVSGEVAQRERMRKVARKSGARIRARLHEQDVVNEARIAIENDLGADVAYLHLLGEHGKPGPAVGHEDDWLMPEGFLEVMWPETLPILEDLFRHRAGMLIQDMTNPDFERLMPQITGPIRAAGIVSHLLMPFGDDEKMLGFIAAERLRHGHPWTRPEVETVESIAADIGRGLHHARLYEQEQRLVEELKSVNEMRTEFFTTVAHELRSPLTGVEGYVEMLREGEGGPVTDTQRAMLEAIGRGAGRLRALIDDLFTLAKLEAGGEKPSLRPVELAGVVTGAAEALRPSAAVGGLDLTSSCPQGLAVSGDPSQLDQALVNLLSNAVKYTPAGGHVSVSASTEDGRAVVTVRDSGIGIPEQDRGRLFSRFFRASNAVERHIPGTGLGLAIVQAIVASHGGEIALQSQEGTGTTVTLRLPLAESGHQPAESKITSAGGTGWGKPPARGDRPGETRYRLFPRLAWVEWRQGGAGPGT